MVLAEVLHYVACDSRVSIVTTIPTVIVTIAPKIRTFGLDSKFLSRLDNLTLLNISYSFHVKYLRKYPNYTQIISLSWGSGSVWRLFMDTIISLSNLIHETSADSTNTV
jgi:hypothetical protein